MPGRGRRIAVALIVVALLLSAGRWTSVFLAERLWETAVSERVAQAGARLALQGLGLELLGLAVAIAWFLAHFTIAAHIALPERPPPGRDAVRTWPTQLPRWSLAAAAAVLGALLGSGGGAWLHELLLSVDGTRIGVPDPLLGADLGVFLSRLPLWLDLQHQATVLVVAALGGVLLLHIAGETIRIVGRRLWIFPRARAQLAVLLGLLALCLSWSSGLERYRLAAGLYGPLLPSEFQLGSLVARIQMGLAGLAALFSFLWWYRMRGIVVGGLWVLFGIALLVGRGLPLHGDAASADPDWEAAARGLDSIAFKLGTLESTTAAPARGPLAVMVPTLWDDTVLALSAADSGRLSDPRRSWIRIAARSEPVWFAVRELRGQPAALIAVSDDSVGASGAPLAWREADSLPGAGIAPLRTLAAYEVRPLAGNPVLTSGGGGVALDSWISRIVLAWALQAPKSFSAPRGTRIIWRLDPTMRLRAIAPFVHWTAPRARPTAAGLVWQSDGLLVSSLLPSSARIDWGAGKASMVRSAFLGVVNARDGRVRIFRREPGDSLAAAWARVTRPLIEPPEAAPAELRGEAAYPDELLLAQAHVLEGVSWSAGKLESIPPENAGGSEHLVPFNRSGTRKVGALLVARRTAAGDSLRLIRLDSLWAVDAASSLAEMWKRFPFRQALEEEVLAAGDSLKPGQVRYALATEGIVAYQPAWAVSSSNAARLVLVNVALGRGNGAKQMSLGTGRSLPDAWRNLRGETSPLSGESGAAALLDQIRRLVLRADSARKRGDLQERERALAELRELLEPRRP
ncbi:MAG TPA: UPF0182 family protein [Gemmatimonadales bacterium]